MEIFFAARGAWRVLRKLESGPVDSIVCAERRREKQPHHECRTSSDLESFRQNIRSVRPEVGSEIIAQRRLIQIGEIVSDLALRISPGEIRVGLRKAQPCQALHHVWPRECLREEDNVRAPFLDAPDSPLPERKRFRVGIVHAEDANTLLNPVFKYIF